MEQFPQNKREISEQQMLDFTDELDKFRPYFVTEDMIDVANFVFDGYMVTLSESLDIVKDEFGYATRQTRVTWSVEAVKLSEDADQEDIDIKKVERFTVWRTNPEAVYGADYYGDIFVKIPGSEGYQQVYTELDKLLFRYGESEDPSEKIEILEEAEELTAVKRQFEKTIGEYSNIFTVERFGEVMGWLERLNEAGPEKHRV